MKQIEKLSLPIDIYIPQILKAVQDYSTVMVKASPGSGKTTRLPWALASHLSKKVVVLEPRRLAAKLAATRISEEENLILGQEVGYHFRFEKNATQNSRLIFYTEGTFLKKFLTDPELNDVDVVILDEFHERHLETDLALALLRDLQKRRPALKIILMSATLDLKLIEALPESKSIEIEAIIYPIDVTYLPNQPSILSQSLEQKVKRAIESIQHEGDILVFLPGMREMLKVKEVLAHYNVFLLHAELTREEQDLAIKPASKQKIILATNIAESSITIPGIRVVIDSGIQREAHYSAWNGLKFIEDRPVTKSSAIQRAGRAGRTGPGLCLRLYSQQDFNERPDHTIPEIIRADLTDIYLLVKGSGHNPHWFHPPPAEKWDKARLLLERMGALEKDGLITSIGKKMLEWPLDSRLARILIAGENLPLKSKQQLLKTVCEDIEDDRTGSLKRRLNFYLKTEGTDNFSWESCLLKGFVDQVARFREKQRDFIHYSGKTLKIHPSLNHLHEDFYIILDITQRQEAIKVFPVEEEWIWELEPFPLTEDDEILIDERISIKRKTRLGSIVLEEDMLKPNWVELGNELKKKISLQSQTFMKQKISLWKETPEYGRLHFWSRQKGHDLETLIEELSPKDYFNHTGLMEWHQLSHYLQRLVEEKLDVTDLDRQLPTHINLGGKRELKVHYPFGMGPYLEAPIQDFYGINETPTLMQGKIPLTLKLLGPHKRPIQVTKDLKNFWQKTYQEMKKEYQRDYPRHHWPERPWEAKPILLKSQLPRPQ